MAKNNFYAEYSRLRSIARKRIERAAAAGMIEKIELPTVKEVRASLFPEFYMEDVKRILEGGSLASARKTGVQMVQPTVSPLDQYAKDALKPLTPEAKRARRNEQKRRSKAKRAVEKAVEAAGGTEKEARKKVGYLRALETVAEKWREQGVDMGNWLGVMSPAMAKSFVNYMEYRFSQGDYKNRYTMDTFIKDFGTLVEKGYDFRDIQRDFGAFLGKEKELKKGKRRTNKYGVSTDEVDSAWRRFAASR